jgi:hypothetical protein
LGELPEIRSSAVWADAADSLSRTWRSVVRGRHEVTEHLLDDLDTASTYATLLATWGPRKAEAGSVALTIDRLCRDVSEALDRASSEASGSAERS